VDDHERPLALEDVGEIVLPHGRFIAQDVEEVVLDLKSDGGVLAEFLERPYLPLGRPTDDRSCFERSDPAIVAGLAQGHLEIVVRRQVEDVITHPAYVQRLAFDRVFAHLADDVHHRQLCRIVQQWITHHYRADQPERVVAGIDGQRLPVEYVGALSAPAQKAGVHDVVVYEGRSMEELYGTPGGHGLPRVSAHRLAGQHGHSRTGAFAAPGDEFIQDAVQVTVKRRVPRDFGQITVKVFVDLRTDRVQIVDEEIALHILNDSIPSTPARVGTRPAKVPASIERLSLPARPA